jgi:hypothetical protein
VFEQVNQDVRFGFRQLYKSPGFALTAILTLALGVGANTAIFTLIDSIVLRPLPFPHQERLVFLSADSFFPKGWIRALQQNSQSFQSLSAYGDNAESNVAGVDSTERVFGSRITSIPSTPWAFIPNWAASFPPTMPLRARTRSWS